MYLECFFATLVLQFLGLQLAAGDDDANRPAPIRIGILHSQSGTMASSEKSLVDAAQMAIDEINHSGGVLGRRLEAVIEDGASDPPTFALKAEKLLGEDNVTSLFGCWTSSSRKSVIPVLRIGRIQRDGQFRVIWSSGDPLPPRPVWIRSEEVAP